MAAQDTASLLAQLRDIQLPAAPAEPALWPTLAAALLLACALMVKLLLKRRHKTSWFDEAIQELNEIRQVQPAVAVHRTAALLKRIVLTHDSSLRHETGEQWLHSLDNFFCTSYFTCGDGQIFGDSLYTNTSTIPKTLYRDIKKLIRKRKRQQ